MRVAAIIPARNEAVTVGDVVRVARGAARVDEVIVVENGSTDATAELARAAGARVVTEEAAGKGAAMRAGVHATEAELIVFLDADLLNLRSDHVDRLVASVDHGAGMACGLFDRGRVLNPAFEHLLPVLTGQRAMRRELFERVPLHGLHGYRIEAALNSMLRRERLPVDTFVCDGLWHRTKEEKYDNSLFGLVAKLAMLATAVGEYIAFPIRERLPRAWSHVTGGRSRSSDAPRIGETAAGYAVATAAGSEAAVKTDDVVWLVGAADEIGLVQERLSAIEATVEETWPHATNPGVVALVRTVGRDADAASDALNAGAARFEREDAARAAAADLASST